MKPDATFANATARSRESSIITTEKFSRMAGAGSAEEAFGILRDYGFGKEAEVGHYTEYEKLIAKETESLTDFIREYSASQSFKAYCLLKNDFHNAEVAAREKKVGKLNAYLADGLTEAKKIREYSEGKKNAEIPDYLKDAMKEAEELDSGERVSDLFVKAYYKEALKMTSGEFREFLRREIDFKNISVAARSGDVRVFDSQFISGGRIAKKDLVPITEKNYAKARANFACKEESEFVNIALSEAEKGPLSEFERYAESYPLRKLSAKKYEPTGITPFAVYCLYKTNEIKNVRIVMVGKIAGLSAEDIKRRMKENYAG